MLNAAGTAALAIYGSVEAWTFHTSILSYVLMGVLFAAEWVVRKIPLRRHACPGGGAVKSFELARADAARLCAFDGEGAELAERTYGQLRALAFGVANRLRSSGTSLPALLFAKTASTSPPLCSARSRQGPPSLCPRVAVQRRSAR